MGQENLKPFVKRRAVIVGLGLTAAIEATLPIAAFAESSIPNQKPAKVVDLFTGREELAQIKGRLAVEQNILADIVPLAQGLPKIETKEDELRWFGRVYNEFARRDWVTDGKALPNAMLVFFDPFLTTKSQIKGGSEVETILDSAAKERKVKNSAAFVPARIYLEVWLDETLRNGDGKPNLSIIRELFEKFYNQIDEVRKNQVTFTKIGYESQELKDLYTRILGQNLRTVVFTASRIPTPNNESEEWMEWGREVKALLEKERFIVNQRLDPHTLVIFIDSQGKRVEFLENLYITPNPLRASDYRSLTALFEKEASKQNSSPEMARAVLDQTAKLIQKLYLTPTAVPTREQTIIKSELQPQPTSQVLKEVSKKELQQNWNIQEILKFLGIGLGVAVPVAAGGYTGAFVLGNRRRRPFQVRVEPDPEYQEAVFWKQRRAETKAAFDKIWEQSGEQLAKDRVARKVLEGVLDKIASLKLPKKPRGDIWKDICQTLGVQMKKPRQFNEFIKPQDQLDVKSAKKLISRLTRSILNRNTFSNSSNLKDAGILSLLDAKSALERNDLEVVKTSLITADSVRLNLNTLSFIEQYKKSIFQEKLFSIKSRLAEVDSQLQGSALNLVTKLLAESESLFSQQKQQAAELFEVASTFQKDLSGDPLVTLSLIERNLVIGQNTLQNPEDEAVILAEATRVDRERLISLSRQENLPEIAEKAQKEIYFSQIICANALQSYAGEILQLVETRSVNGLWGQKIKIELAYAQQLFGNAISDALGKNDQEQIAVFITKGVERLKNAKSILRKALERDDRKNGRAEIVVYQSTQVSSQTT